MADEAKEEKKSKKKKKASSKKHKLKKTTPTDWKIVAHAPMNPGAQDPQRHLLDLEQIDLEFKDSGFCRKSRPGSWFTGLHEMMKQRVCADILPSKKATNKKRKRRKVKETRKEREFEATTGFRMQDMEAPEVCVFLLSSLSLSLSLSPEFLLSPHSNRPNK